MNRTQQLSPLQRRFIRVIYRCLAPLLALSDWWQFARLARRRRELLETVFMHLEVRRMVDEGEAHLPEAHFVSSAATILEAASHLGVTRLMTTLLNESLDGKSRRLLQEMRAWPRQA